MEYRVLNIYIFISEINECESHPCKNNGTCADLVNNFTCWCPDGYEGHLCDKGEYAFTRQIECCIPHITHILYCLIFNYSTSFKGTGHLEVL